MLLSDSPRISLLPSVFFSSVTAVAAFALRVSWAVGFLFFFIVLPSFSYYGILKVGQALLDFGRFTVRFSRPPDSLSFDVTLTGLSWKRSLWSFALFWWLSSSSESIVSYNWSFLPTRFFLDSSIFGVFAFLAIFSGGGDFFFHCAMSLFRYIAPAAVFTEDGNWDVTFPLRRFVRAFRLFLLMSLRSKIGDHVLFFSSTGLSSIKFFSHEYNSSFLSSGLIVLVSSTSLRVSLSDASRRVVFQRALASSSVFNAFARYLSFAGSDCCSNSGLTSRLFDPFDTILT